VGQPYRFAYKQSWTTQPNPAGAAGWVVNSRSGTHEWAPDTRYVVLEFAGPALAALPKETGEEGEVKLEAEVSVTGANVVLAGPARVQKVPGGDTYRVAFEIKKTAKDAKVDGAELRCSLKKGADYLSETWTGWLPL
jgi:glucan biosynthesis protein